MALTLAQLLRQTGSEVPVHAVVPMYPAVDLVMTATQKLATRRWKPALGGFRGRDSDMLAAVAPMCDWTYIPAGTDHRNPMLSPLYGIDAHAYADLDVFVVACELDNLAHEA